MTLLERLRNVLIGRPDTGVTLDPNAISKAAEATQVVISRRHELCRKNDNDRFLRGVLESMHR